MPPRPRKIAQHEWERHKKTIRDLYAQHTLPKVIERLQEEFGFSASLSQYEAQLKSWGFKKNLTRSEWVTHLANSDGQPSSSFTTSSGRLKDKKKIQRAKRYIETTRKAGAAQITIPFQLTDLTASAHAPEQASCLDIQGQQHFTLQPSSVPPFDNGLMNMGSSLDHKNDNPPPSTQDSLTSELPNSLESESNEYFHETTTGLPSNSVITFQQPASPTFGMPFENAEHPQFLTFQLQTENWSPLADGLWDQPFFNADGRSFGSPQRLASKAPSLYRQETSFETDIALQSISVIQSGLETNEPSFDLRNGWLQNLPFAKFEAFLSGQGMALTSKSDSALNPSFIGSLTLLSIMNTLSQTDGSAVGHVKKVKTRFWMLSSLIPNMTGAVIEEQQITDTSIIRMLIFSMINGFAGMNEIRIESLLLCLRRLEIVNPLLQLFLSGPSSPAKRSFVDNIFKASIDSRDEEMVEIILKTALVDVDNTICFEGGRRRTPIERAASLRAFSIVRILAEHGVDVSKTYVDPCEFGMYSECSTGGALECLLSNVSFPSYDDATSLELVETVRVLLAKGSKVRITHLNRMGGGSTNEVASLLCQAVSLADHRAFFEVSDTSTDKALVVQTAGLFHAGISITIMKNMIQLCQSRCGSCLAEFADVIEEAAVEAAIRGRVEVVELIIDYAKSTDLILIAAIRSENPDLIQFLLSREPNLNPPAHSYAPLCKGHGFVVIQSIPTTPFAEAIRTNDSQLIHLLESEGCGAFHSLTDHRRLLAAILGAVEGGNTSYLRRLLSIASATRIKYRIPAIAVELALRHGHEQATQLLVEEGAELGWTVLEVALKKRNPKTVAVVLATDLSYDPGTRISTSTAEHAIKWAEPSVLQSMIYTMPDMEIPVTAKGSVLADFCWHCIMTHNFDLFRVVVESTSKYRKDWDGCLEEAVDKGDRRMASYLLQQGANPFNSKVLKAAIKYRPEMLSFLFGNASHDGDQARHPQKSVGASLIHFLLNEDAGNAKASVLDQLLETGAVNLVVPEKIEGAPVFTYVTPLGLAILGIPDCCNPNLHAINKFVDAGADPDGLARLDRHPYRCVTALMAAVETGRREVVTMMIERGADVNLQPRLSLRRTPLQYATELGNLEMIRLLLQEGADINSPPALQGGGTALQFAAISGTCNIAAELLEHGASLDILPSKRDGRWPLEGAAEHGRLDMIQLLWNAREISPGNVGFEKRQCLRAMDFARENGHFGCRDLISELSGLSVEMLDTEDYGVPWLAY